MKILFFILAFILVMSCIVGCANVTKTSATIKSPSSSKNLPVGSITQTWSW